MKPVRAISVLPTMFTLGNLVCGFFAIVVASRVPAPSARPVDVEAVRWLDGEVQLDVLAKDRAGRQGNLKIVEVVAPAHGSAGITPGEPEAAGAERRDRIHYVPEEGYSGDEKITYTVEDKDGRRTTSSVLFSTAGQLKHVMWDLMQSGWLIFIAMLFDALDGHVARLSRTSSDFGAELDSLCDVVSFGVAPAFLLVKMVPRFAYLHREAVWIIAATFAACAALRLARFNVETSDEDDHLHFSGLPSPAAAGAVAGFAIVFYTLVDPELGFPRQAATIYAVLQAVLPFFALLVALLMVSRIRYPHVVNQMFRGQKSFAHIVKLLFALVAVMVIKGYAVPLVFCGFALSGPTRLIWTKLRRKKPEPLAEEEEESVF